MQTAPLTRIIMEAAASAKAAEEVRTALIETAAGWDRIVDPVLATVAAIHAAFAGDDVSNDFPGAFTQPDVPRALAVTFAASWDGGDVTVVGIDARGEPASEVFTAAAGTQVVGNVPFASVTGATKGAVGATANAASIDDTAKLGLSKIPVAADLMLLKADGTTEEPAAVDTTYGTVTATTALDGSVDIAAFYAANIS